MADLVERNLPAVPAHQREVRQTRRIQPLAAGAARHDGDIADVLADLRDGDAGEEELELLAHLRWREADEVQPILIRDEAQHGRAIAPVAVGLPHVRDAPHDVEGFFGDVVQLRGIGSHDPELDRERRVGAEHELGDAHIGLRRKPLRHRLAEPMLQRLARLRVRRQHDDLGEGGIRQFRRHREEEAGSALTDIARDDLGLGLVLQPVFELFDRGGRRLDAGAFRQANLHQHFGAVGCREELLFDGAHADDGQREGDADDAAGHELVAHGEGDEPSQAPIVRRVVDRVVTAFDRFDRGQHLDAEIGREDHRDDPGDDEREPDDPEDVAGVFAGRRAREADRQESGDRHERSRQHRRRGVAPRIGRRLDAVHALFHFHHHHLDGDDGVVDEKTERQDERAERDAVEEPAGFQHDEEHDGKRQRDGSRHDDADAPAEAEQAHQQHHAERHRELQHEFVDRRGDVDGLIAHLVERHPERQRLCDRRSLVLQRLAELRDRSSPPA